MELEKLEKMTRMVLNDLSDHSLWSDYIHNTPTLQAKAQNVLAVCNSALPEHHEFFQSIYNRVAKPYPSTYSISETISAIKHILAILEIEKSSEEKIKEMKVFESAEEKLKQANLSFRKDDYTSTFHNLNTALELVLKNKLEIPLTITKINTTKIIDILVKRKFLYHPYLTEAKNHIIRIDNKIKHQGYSPSKIDCINGIKAMEELIEKLRYAEIELTEETRNKIYEGL